MEKMAASVALSPRYTAMLDDTSCCHTAWWVV